MPGRCDAIRSGRSHLEHVLPGLDDVAVGADGVVVVHQRGRAQDDELLDVEARHVHPRQLLHHQAGEMRTHREAVRLFAVHVLGCLEAGTAGDVPDDEPGAARKVLGGDLGEHAAEEIVAAARAGADDEVDGLALEAYVLRGNVASQQQDGENGDQITHASHGGFLSRFPGRQTGTSGGAAGRQAAARFGLAVNVSRPSASGRTARRPGEGPGWWRAVSRTAPESRTPLHSWRSWRP